MVDQRMSSKSRKPYRKPRIEQVKLVPDEAVLAACKTPSSGGGQNVVGVGSCSLDGTPGACVLDGS